MRNKNNKQQASQVKKQQKIGFLSVVLLVIGSTLGAGIFFKNKEVMNNNHGNVVLTFVCWIIAIFGVMAMGITLAELSSGSKQNNKEGTIGWVKTFCNNYLYKVARCFMTWIYSPLSFFFLPYYALLSIQDGVFLATGNSIPWYIIVVCSFATMIWFALTAGFSVKTAHIQNWIITAIKFLPVAIVVIVGFVICGNGNPQGDSYTSNSSGKLFTDITPLFGVIASIPAIFFAFDGFYTVSSNTSEMKNPSKAPLAMAIGLLVLSVIDIIITFAMLYGTKDGSVYSITDWLKDKNLIWLGVALDVMIGIGIFGILNGFALFDSFYYGALIKIGELPLSKWLRKYKINIGGTIYKTICAIIAFVLFTIIGCFYLKGKGYAGNEFTGTEPRLYYFVDTMANWTALLSFGGIVIAQIGALRNRWTKKVKTQQTKWFIPCAIFSVSLVCLGSLYIVCQQIANVIITGGHLLGNTMSPSDGIIPASISLGVLILFLAIMFIYPIFEIKYSKGKTNTLADITIK